MEINLNEHDLIPLEILSDTDQLRTYLEKSDLGERYVALFQSVEAMVGFDSQAAILEFIPDVTVRDVAGWTYLDHLSELYWSAYEQNDRPYPDPMLEQNGYERWIRAAVDFGFDVTDRSRDYIRRTGNSALLKFLDEGQLRTRPK